MRPGELGETKLENLDPPIPGEKDVFRLQIAINNATVVRRYQPACNSWFYK